jgi:hypothetical protein
LRIFPTLNFSPENLAISYSKLPNLQKQTRMLRTTVVRQARLFATSPALQRGPVQVGKDALKTVDRAVADTLVKGIETGGVSPPPSLSLAFFFVGQG